MNEIDVLNSLYTLQAALRKRFGDDIRLQLHQSPVYGDRDTVIHFAGDKAYEAAVDVRTIHRYARIERPDGLVALSIIGRAPGAR